MKRISSLFLALCLAGSFGLIGCSGEQAPEIDRADLNDRCDYALSTILNSDELLGCEVAFEVCADWELQNLVRQFECDTGEVTEGCSETGRPDVDQTCYAQIAMTTPPENSQYVDNGLVSVPGTNWCGPGDKATDTIPPAHCNDASCRRHDHCDNRGQQGSTSSTLLCGCDKRIYDSTSSSVDGLSNAAVAVVFHKNFALWPCLAEDEVCTKREWGWHGEWFWHYACVQYTKQWGQRSWNKYSGDIQEHYLDDPQKISATNKGDDVPHCGG
jgi:hypothetical protein